MRLNARNGLRLAFCFLSFACAISVLAPLSHATDRGDVKAVKACLDNWKKHPFNAEDPTFRTIATQVKVMGIGHDLDDHKATTQPELILVKPNVSVMSKTVMSLMNPNGWYCLKGKVAVLGKTQINLACTAHLASTDDGATVLGSNKAEDGVTVLGSSEVKRSDCKKAGE